MGFEYNDRRGNSVADQDRASSCRRCTWAAGCRRKPALAIRSAPTTASRNTSSCLVPILKDLPGVQFVECRRGRSAQRLLLVWQVDQGGLQGRVPSDQGPVWCAEPSRRCFGCRPSTTSPPRRASNSATFNDPCANLTQAESECKNPNLALACEGSAAQWDFPGTQRTRSKA